MATNNTTSTVPTKRYAFAKQYRRVNGTWAWGVYDDVKKTFVEGGFFGRMAARLAADRWNEEIEKEGEQ